VQFDVGVELSRFHARCTNAKVPIFHIHGDKDTVVPGEQNAAEPARRYKALGGDMQVLLAKDQAHSYWQGFFKCQELVDFLLKNARTRKGRFLLSRRVAPRVDSRDAWQISC
jgi:hypothetical protein